MSVSNLVIVAHPDDETIFFGGTILSFKNRGWRVVVVTDGNADSDAANRRRQLELACQELGVREFQHWDFPDVYEKRLNTGELIERFKTIKVPRTVYTHGIIGEYGHPHHQDVSWAVHKFFHKAQVPVWSVAYNSFATKTVDLARKNYDRKARIYSEIYNSETSRFAHLLPVRNQEGFHRAEWREVDHLYSYFTGKLPEVDVSLLKTYRSFAPFLGEQKKVSQKREF